MKIRKQIGNLVLKNEVILKFSSLASQLEEIKEDGSPLLERITPIQESENEDDHPRNLFNKNTTPYSNNNDLEIDDNDNSSISDTVSIVSKFGKR